MAHKTIIIPEELLTRLKSRQKSHQAVAGVITELLDLADKADNTIPFDVIGEKSQDTSPAIKEVIEAEPKDDLNSNPIPTNATLRYKIINKTNPEEYFEIKANTLEEAKKIATEEASNKGWSNNWKSEKIEGGN